MSEHRRLFFALWPEDLVRNRLAEAGQVLHQAGGGKLTRRESIHLTLAFLGNVPLTSLPTLERIAESISAPPFQLRIDQLRYWPHNQIAFAAPSETPLALLSLVSDLYGKLKQAQFKVDDRPYAPHITLVRSARPPKQTLEINPIDWQVHEFVLVQSAPSNTGSLYSVIGRWACKSGSLL